MVAAFIPQAAISEAFLKASAREVVEARAMLAELKEAVSEIEQDFIDLTTELGVETVELADGTLVTRIDADRRKIDANRLAEIVTATTFDRVTDRKVNHKKFDSAIEVGLITPDTVEQTVTRTPYTAIRVTPSK